jgi:hypothetical protein
MRQPVPTDKILITVLFWDGDKGPAMKLARLLADLEPIHSERADFLFVSRFDSSHDDATIRHVSRKFNVFHYISKRRGEGWPLGCNGVFFGAMEFIYHKMAAAQMLNYKAVLVIGGDGAPLRTDWLEIFHREWDKANQAAPTYVAGAMITAGGVEHINGDCMLLSGKLDFMKWLAVTIGDVTTNAGWDWILPHEFRRWGWINFPFVRSSWNYPAPFTQQQWDLETQAGVVWFHGVKEYSLLDLCRKNMLTV